LAKFSVVYIALCELAFAVNAGVLGFTVGGGTGLRAHVFGVVMILLFVLNAGTFFGLIRSKRWSWYSSWVIGLIVVGLSCWIVRLAMRPDPFGDSGSVGVFGIAFLLFALPAFVLLSLPSTRRRLHVGNL